MNTIKRSIPIFKHKEIFLKVFPELEPIYKGLEEKKGCCKGGYSPRDIWIMMQRLHKKKEDLTPLNDLPKHIKQRIVRLPLPAKTCERIPCQQCYKKHLSQAAILLGEVLQGYDEEPHLHKWLCIGHLAEASDEIVGVEPLLANQVRLIRLDITENFNNLDALPTMLNQIKTLISEEIYNETDTSN
jgi:hypothetical protein